MSPEATKARNSTLLLFQRPVRMWVDRTSSKTTRKWWPQGLLPRLAVLALLPFLASGVNEPEPREADKDTTAIVQASYIYNIAKLVEWNDPGQKDGLFIISVLGSTNLYEELVKKYATKSIGKQAIEVRKLARSTEVARCHILFVAQTELSLLPALYKRFEKQGTLLITEYPDAMEDGAVVNFVRVENTLKYEISVVNARKHKLEVGSTLIQLAYKAQE